MSSLLAFKNKLEEIMNNLASNKSTEPFCKVVSFNDPDLKDFPFIQIVQLDGGTVERLTSVSNLVAFDYMIRGIWSMETYNQDIEDDILSAQDDMLDEFHKVPNLDTLDGTVAKFDIVSMDRFASTEDEPYIGLVFHVRGTYKKVATT